MNICDARPSPILMQRLHSPIRRHYNSVQRTAKVIRTNLEEVQPHPKGVTVDELEYAKATPSRKTNCF